MVIFYMLLRCDSIDASCIAATSFGTPSCFVFPESERKCPVRVRPTRIMAQTPHHIKEIEAKASVTRYTALMSEGVEKLARGANIRRYAFKNTPEEVGNGFVAFCFLGSSLCHCMLPWSGKLATRYVRRWREVNRPKCVTSIGG